MSGNSAIDIAALSAAETCRVAYNGKQDDFRTACTLGVSDGVHHAKDAALMGQTQTLDQWNTLCMMDAKSSSLPANQQLPYQIGCQVFATGYMQ